MKKMLLATAALAVVIASPALAHAGSRAATGPIYGQAVPYGAWGAYAQTPPGAFVSTSRDAGLGGDYVGTDPDPDVRLQLLKDAQDR